MKQWFFLVVSPWIGIFAAIVLGRFDLGVEHWGEVVVGLAVWMGSAWIPFFFTKMRKVDGEASVSVRMVLLLFLMGFLGVLFLSIDRMAICGYGLSDIPHMYGLLQTDKWAVSSVPSSPFSFFGHLFWPFILMAYAFTIAFGRFFSPGLRRLLVIGCYLSVLMVGFCTGGRSNLLLLVAIGLVAGFLGAILNGYNKSCCLDFVFFIVGVGILFTFAILCFYWRSGGEESSEYCVKHYSNMGIEWSGSVGNDERPFVALGNYFKMTMAYLVHSVKSWDRLLSGQGVDELSGLFIPAVGRVMCRFGLWGVALYSAVTPTFRATG